MPEQRFGPYRLLSLLGSGGMGEVWQAVDTRKDRQVALKVLRAGLAGDANYARRFRREAALVAKLTGPHIVPIHDYGEIDGRLFIDMPLLDGSDLGVLLERGGPMPAARAVGIASQVARALDVAHRAGLVHRDIKPSNILVCDSGGTDHAYLIDFGISRALDGTSTTVTGSIIGTPAYMAPERFAGEGDHRSDVYALGCVLYEGLTGQLPFSATNPLMFMNAHQNLPAPRPSDRRPDIPSRLDDVIGRALAKAPDERYPSASELAIAARLALTAAGATPASNPPRADPAHQRRHERELPSESRAPTALTIVPAGPRRRAVIAALGASAIIGMSIAGVAIFRPSEPADIGSADAARPTPAPIRTTPAPIRTTPVPERVFGGHTNSVTAVAAAQLDNRSVIVTGSVDNTVRVWDLAAGTPIGQPLAGHTDAVRALATSRLDGRTVIVTGGLDRTVRVWDLAAGTPIGPPLVDQADAVTALVATQLDDRVAVVTGGINGTVRVWDLATGVPIGRPLTGHAAEVIALATTQLDGRTVIISGSGSAFEDIDNSIRVWDLATGDPIGQPLTGHTEGVRALTTAQLDGRPVIVSGSFDETVRVWDLATGAPIGRPLTGHNDNVITVATAQLDGRPVIISGGNDAAVRLWDLTRGTPIGQPFSGHTEGVLALATAQLDGRTVVISGSTDNTIRTWDLVARARS